MLAMDVTSLDVWMYMNVLMLIICTAHLEQNGLHMCPLDVLNVALCHTPYAATFP